ncbi:MAG: crossover junction endodeoxyribonuclease RuvC [Bacteroidetes bacterium GWF2_29_10]|nr:MAG: crossover junction endodeoxyribonuclease RuvC [Bacteroidetes bacterium GWF2_29_10]
MKKVIIGIDPGTISLGYGIILVSNKDVVILEYDSIDLGKKDILEIKLKNIFFKIVELIDRHKVNEMAVEAPFYGKNVQSMLKLGKAQGVAIAAGLSRSLPFFEYTPRKIKQSITGNGNASKEQIASMLINLNYLKELPKKLDTTDALATALCHYMQGSSADNTNNSSHSKNKYNSWSSFISDNSERVVKQK